MLEMEFCLSASSNDGKHNGAGLVEISELLATQDDCVDGVTTSDRMFDVPCLA